jgi:hypothetical protein
MRYIHGTNPPDVDNLVHLIADLYIMTDSHFYFLPGLQSMTLKAKNNFE